MERQSMFMAGRLNIVKMAIFPTSIFKFNSISFFCRMGIIIKSLYQKQTTEILHG